MLHLVRPPTDVAEAVCRGRKNEIYTVIGADANWCASIFAQTYIMYRNARSYSSCAAHARRLFRQLFAIEVTNI